ncbi:MAG TPA: RDD family protein, partial [Terriglobales bacterium]|nr:RDD family protein [Terriglobales bacterium]
MACPRCGDECHCAPLPEEESSHVSVLIDPEDFDASEQQFAVSLERPAAAASAADAPLSAAPATRPEPPLPAAARDFHRPDDTWRREVSSRVDAYRRRRRRYDPEASLPLNFDATQPQVEPQGPPLPSFARAQAAAQALAEAPKIIEFPRPSTPAAEELAEPLVETPRILEAAEVVEEPPRVEPSPPMPAITLPAEQEEAAAAQPEEPELVLPVAPMSQRVQATVVDSVVVLAACALFAMIFLKLAGEAPHGRMALALASLIPSFFWAAYQYIFLVYAGTTPGMQAAQLSLETFDGVPPTRRVRRFRALAMAISCMSLGLGYLWALVDEDRL